MTSEAPERISALVKPARDGWYQSIGIPCGQRAFPATNYIRADLPQQAIEAAREEGYAQAVDEMENRAWAFSQTAWQGITLPDVGGFMRREIREIRALSPTPADPVAEAAIPYTPTTAQIQSVCYSMSHDYGLMTRAEQEKLEFRAAEAWRAVASALAQKE